MKRASAKRTYQKRKNKDPEFLEKSRIRGKKYYRTNHAEVRKRVNSQRDAEPENFRKSSKGMRFDIALHDMIRAAGNRCEICRTRFEAKDWNRVVDHHHDTKRVRGILCRRCNLLLGHAKESVRILEGAIAYLQRYASLSEIT